MNGRVLTFLTTTAAQLVAVRHSQWPTQSTSLENFSGEELGGLVSLEQCRSVHLISCAKGTTVQSTFNLWGTEKGEERAIVLDPTLSFDSCVLEEEKDEDIKKCSFGRSGLLLHWLQRINVERCAVSFPFLLEELGTWCGELLNGGLTCSRRK